MNKYLKSALCAISITALVLMPNLNAYAKGKDIPSEEPSELTEDYSKLIKNNAGIETVLSQTDDIEFPEGYFDNYSFYGYKNIGIAHVDNHLNVRELPSQDGKLVGKMSNNAACEIVGYEDNWAHIQSGEVEGWASLDYLYTGMDAVKIAKETVSLTATVTGDALRVRSEPNTDSEIITSIPKGEHLEVSEVLEDGWIECFLDDEIVYLNAEFCEVSELLPTAITMTELLYGAGVSDVRVELCQYAQTFIGNPYVYGGSSLTKGTDCSGFTMSIYKKYGVKLPHNAASQATMGTKVSLSELKPGDLVFYGTKKHINHVVIYIGNGQVCHASNAKYGIRISDLYYRTPVCARSYLID